MRILYFSPRDCWPLTTGARLRDYHLAHQLAQRAEVIYAALQAHGANSGELPADAGFRQVAIPRDKGYSIGKLIGGVLGPIPVTIRNYTSAKAMRSLSRLLTESKFDVVQIEGVHLVEYIPVIRKYAPQATLVADWHNIESELMWRYAETAPGLPQRLMARRTAALIEKAEDTLLKRCDAHTVVSEREQAKLLARQSQARVSVVPNGVDIVYYQNPLACKMTADSGPLRDLLFVGSMDYHANIDAVVWFIHEVWPEIRSRHPDLRIRIVGRDPAAEVNALASVDVEITGTVDDTRPYYRSALAIIVPLRVGGGTRLKILEAMAAGVPVVSTTLGAEGLAITDGVHLLLADTTDRWVEQIGRLMEKAELAESLVREGKQLVERLYDWPVAGERLYSAHLASTRLAK